MKKQEWLELIKAEIKQNGEVFWQGIFEELPLSRFQRYCKELGLEQISEGAD